MRVLWLSYYYLPHVGAATWATYYLSLSLSKKGHLVQLIVPNVRYGLSIPMEFTKSLWERKHLRVHRTPVFPIPRKLGPLLSSLFILCAGLRFCKNVDILVSQHHPHHLLTPIAVLLGRILKVPVVLRADDVYREMRVKLGLFNRLVKIINTFNEYFIKYADTFLAVCSENKEILLSSLRGNATNCHVGLSPNGVDLSEFKDTLNKEDARKLLGFKHKEKVILFVGRFSGAEYRIEVLLRALPIIIKDTPEALVVLVGDRLTPNQRALMNSLKIGKNIRVYGPKPHKEVIKFISAADVCIGPLMPGDLAIPLKILEYMACGKPIVTAVKSLSRDLASNNPNFLFVPPEPKAVSEAILSVLQDEDYARRLGSNLSKTVTKFSWDKVASNLEELLVELKTRVKLRR